jgi:23S rRNA pseudouridine1911/1915/1917 synthase
MFYKNGFLIFETAKKVFLKSFLKEKGLSSNIINALLNDGKILVNDKKIVKNKKFSGTVKLKIYDGELSDYVPIEKKIDILYEDDFFLILNKPYGEILFFTSDNSKPCIASYVNYYYVKTGQKHKLRFVNRLDKDTTGILIIAKNRFAHHYIYENHKKVYAAITPKLYKNSGKIEKPLIRRMPFTYVCESYGKYSCTIFRKICDKNEFSFVMMKLKTGRTHQIRAHFKYLGFPLIGDKHYGGYVGDGFNRTLLHCYRMSFIHPVDGKFIKITAPLPDDMKKILN